MNNTKRINDLFDDIEKIIRKDQNSVEDLKEFGYKITEIQKIQEQRFQKLRDQLKEL